MAESFYASLGQCQSEDELIQGAPLRAPPPASGGAGGLSAAPAALRRPAESGPPQGAPRAGIPRRNDREAAQGPQP
jgi:hypothetical protein